MKTLDIIFMGSAQFSCFALQEILKVSNNITPAPYKIIAVYSKAPKPAHRGKKLSKTPLHILAESLNLEVRTPASLKNEVLPPCDLIILVAYGLILPKNIIEHPKMGCINIHPSLLPRWRGAAPIEQAILAGDKETGVSIVKMTEELDAGDIYSQEKIPLLENESYSSLHDRLALLGNKILMATLENFTNFSKDSRISKNTENSAKTNFLLTPQTQEGVTYANKLSNSIELDFNNSADLLIRQINAFKGGATMLFKTPVKIIKALKAELKHGRPPGEVLVISPNILHIFCANSILVPIIIQPIGKKPMDIKSFLNGHLL